MAKKNYKIAQNIGKTKRTTDNMIDDAIAKQNSWMDRRRKFARRFLKSMNIFARPSKVKKEDKALDAATPVKVKKTGLSAYWFPILCAAIVIAIAVWVAFFRNIPSQPAAQQNVIVIPVVPEPVVNVVDEAVNEKVAPGFDIVRIEPAGTVIVAGRWLPNQNISIVMNKKIVATERTDSRGEFVYAPAHALKPGNYTISLVGVETEIESENKVFIYISEHGYKNSISLLMTKKGSTLMQSPVLQDGDLSVSKIDYLDNGRIVVTGNALPRLRVSLNLNDKYLGFARVSDHKHYGLGADVEKLESGKEYKLSIRLHDGDGKTVAEVEHKFTMPEMTGDEDTFYTVRRGDCLWIIARNFLRRGILFSIVATRNDIKNPDLIYPKQVLQIPTQAK